MTLRSGVRDEKMSRQTPTVSRFFAFNGYDLSRIPAYNNSGAGGGGHVR